MQDGIKAFTDTRYSQKPVSSQNGLCCVLNGLTAGPNPLPYTLAFPQIDRAINETALAQIVGTNTRLSPNQRGANAGPNLPGIHSTFRIY